MARHWNAPTPPSPTSSGARSNGRTRRSSSSRPRTSPRRPCSKRRDRPHQQVLEGYPGKRYYGGNYVVDDAENLARERALELFGGDHANVQPHSGANANMAAFLAVLEPGDKVMGMRLDQGGHLTHGSPVNFSGRFYDFVAYGVDDTAETLDYDAIRELAKREHPKLIIAGATAYSRIIDFEAFRSIADERC